MARRGRQPRVGRWFIWDGASPALLIGGGSGVVPLMAMLRLARTAAQQPDLVVSTRTERDLIYAAELASDDATILYTRAAPSGTTRQLGRITADDVKPLVQRNATVYICGSAAFADAATERALEAGVESQAIRVERFGPTG